ncbi:MAG: DoxX family protein [Gammaproteobacteria bacterium]|nr:DoxX family protein [Gammaproteobacteria bacterium]
MIAYLSALHERTFETIEKQAEGWLTGLTARFVFAAVLLVYYLNSASTKVGDGAFGFLSITDNAYFQILPSVVEAHGFDVTQVPFFPYGLVVAAGTYSEFLLPTLIVLGLFTRIAALGMIGFTIVQSFVDIAYHGVDMTTVGAWFDRFSDAAILDQRALWIFLLLYLVAHGPGRCSLDALLAARRDRQPQ